MAKSSKKVFPGRRLIISHSIGESYYYYYEGYPEITNKEAELLKELKGLKLVGFDIAKRPIVGILVPGPGASLGIDFGFALCIRVLSKIVTTYQVVILADQLVVYHQILSTALLFCDTGDSGILGSATVVHCLTGRVSTVRRDFRVSAAIYLGVITAIYATVCIDIGVAISVSICVAVSTT